MISSSLHYSKDPRAVEKSFKGEGGDGKWGSSCWWEIESGVPHTDGGTTPMCGVKSDHPMGTSKILEDEGWKKFHL